MSGAEPTPEEIAAVMRAMGSMKSKAKAEAARENGKKGGRPRKPKPESR